MFSLGLGSLPQAPRIYQGPNVPGLCPRPQQQMEDAQQKDLRGSQTEAGPLHTHLLAASSCRAWREVQVRTHHLTLVVAIDPLAAAAIVTAAVTANPTRLVATNRTRCHKPDSLPQTGLVATNRTRCHKPDIFQAQLFVQLAFVGTVAVKMLLLCPFHANAVEFRVTIYDIKVSSLFPQTSHFSCTIFARFGHFLNMGVWSGLIANDAYSACFPP